ncbi:hypothetical protein JYT97_03415 [Haliea sp. AH-315-K21]|uniref:Capsule biosynthesis protein n=1 Tax=SAR86 cluster bacterium TaxID=2030880 RepID=A0A2A5C978_9GAMM|nr:hypothetical protein [Haliea sp. AH-315-K21]MBN4075935.1 hypothetical protein [Gammaproteobacteria bacterium AH-315-E17]PCJ40429.1 MAG: hypothetical protein COA71_11280 [SAR86 cluster bacterium]
MPLSVQLYKLSKGQPRPGHAEISASNKLKPKILIAPIFGFSQATLAAESTFARALLAVGASVEFLSCGRGLNHCMWDSLGHLSTTKPNLSEKLARKVRCLECTTSVDAISKAAVNKKALVLDRSTITPIKLINKNSDLIAKASDEHATSSSLRKLLVGELTDSPKDQVVYRNFHRAHEEYKDMLASLFDNELPDRVIMTHGIYLEHGPLIDICHERSIPVYVYGFSYREKTISIVKGDTYHRALLNISRDRWDYPLSSVQKAQLLEYIGSKVSGGRDMVNYHPNPKTSKAGIVDELALDLEKPVISFFTNVTWDANIFYSSNIYEGMLEAIFHTIDYFLIDSSKQLIVRVHPAETKGGFSTKVRLKDMIEERYPSLPGHIKLIGSESDIGSYSLADLSDLNVIYASNIGTELCALGHKVMVLGEAYCRNRGFTIDPVSQDDVWQELSKVLKGEKASQADHELGEKFAYFWFFKAMIDFDFFDYSISNNSLAYFSEDIISLTNDSGEIENANLSEIVSAIVNGRDFDYQKFNSELN